MRINPIATFFITKTMTRPSTNHRLRLVTSSDKSRLQIWNPPIAGPSFTKNSNQQSRPRWSPAQFKYHQFFSPKNCESYFFLIHYLFFISSKERGEKIIKKCLGPGVKLQELPTISLQPYQNGSKWTLGKII